MLFKQLQIKKEIIDQIESILNKYKFEDVSFNKCTKNGFQTDNIVNLFSKNILKKILPINDFYKKIFWIHYIKYNKNGYQTEHNHSKTEKYSFILYLNDSDGDTIFKEPINKRVIPKLGKLIFFNSCVLHRAEMSNEGKKILVGAVEKNVN
jgi:hypothetical protein|tara:strand:- start:490 stop:942 length:453 start_codon:yes stop_codon:yes gene_type:complete